MSKHDTECPDPEECQVGEDVMHCKCKRKCEICCMADVHIHSVTLFAISSCEEDHPICCECTEEYLVGSKCIGTPCSLCNDVCDGCSDGPFCDFHGDNHDCPAAKEEEGSQDGEDGEEEEQEEEYEEGSDIEDEKSTAAVATITKDNDLEAVVSGEWGSLTENGVVVASYGKIPSDAAAPLPKSGDKRPLEDDAAVTVAINGKKQKKG